MILSLKKWPIYLFSLLITLGAGALSGYLSQSGRASYQLVNKSALTPPPNVFPVVWTVLYVLMAVGAALIFLSESPNRTRALIVYAAQLVVNFFWSIFFFNFQAYLFSFFWLLLLLALIIIMVIRFHRIQPVAAWIQIPYLLWVAFAGYLNFMVWYLNR